MPRDKQPCSNCGTLNWGARNDDFCTKCEHSYMDIFYRVFRPERLGINPMQPFADTVLENHGVK